MKIDKTTQPAAPLEPVKADRNAGRAAKAAGVSPAADQVSLSERSRDLQRLGESLAAEPAFDAEKVAAVKLAIENGTFKVDAGKVADGLLASVREVLASRG